MKHTFLATAIIASLFLFSCNDSNNKKTATDVITVEHELGSTEVPAHPKKVVVFDMGSLETLDQFNIPVAGIPKDYVPSYLEKYKDNNKVLDAGSVLAPNLEEVSVIHPDLIIISTLQAKDYDNLKAIAPTIYLGIDNKNFKASVEKKMHTIGQIFGAEELSKQKSSEIDIKIKEASNVISQSDKKIMILLYNNGTFSTFGSESRYGFVYNDLKAKPSDNNKDAGIHGTVVSGEYISEHNPDILYIIDRNTIIDKSMVNKKEIENALIQKTNAFKNNRIIYLDPNVWYLSGGGTYSIEQMIAGILRGYQ